MMTTVTLKRTDPVYPRGTARLVGSGRLAGAGQDVVFVPYNLTAGVWALHGHSKKAPRLATRAELERLARNVGCRLEIDR